MEILEFVVSNLIAFVALALSLYHERRYRSENQPRFDLIDTSVYWITNHNHKSYAVITSTVANRSIRALSVEAIRLRLGTSFSVRPLPPIESSRLWRSISPERQVDRDAVASALSSGVPAVVSAHGAQRIALIFRLETPGPLEELLKLDSMAASRRCTSDTSVQALPDAPPFLRLDIWAHGRMFHHFVSVDIVSFSDHFDIER